MNSRGYAIILDAVMALILIIVMSAAVLSIQHSFTANTEAGEFSRLHYLSEDALDVLNKKGVLDDVAMYWSEDSTPGSESMQNASNLSSLYLEYILPEKVGYRLTIEGETVHDSTGDATRIREEEATAQTSATRLLVGYGRGMPTRGLVARSSLLNILQKSTSDFLYYGGFVGQGNNTKELYLPENITVQSVYLELNAGDDFELYVNGLQCGGTYAPGAGAMAANIKEDLTACAGSFIEGYNMVSINFTEDNISRQYIGGGFLEVEYNTSEAAEDDTGSMRYYFPTIEGFINYYSSFYVPGPVSDMTLNISFKNNHTTYLYIGDKLVFNVSGSESVQRIENDSAQLIGLLGASAVSEKTVPVRLGTAGAGYELTMTTGNADVVLITDLSGSMRWRIGYDDSTQGSQRNCTDPSLYDNDTRRISLAKCLDTQFIEQILNTSGNQVALVGFTTNANTTHALTDNRSSLAAHIESYPDLPNGGTCVCCAINKAIDLLENSSRDKYIIVMTDGIAGYSCGGCAYGGGCGCAGSCDATTGTYDCDGNPSDCNGSQCDTAIGDAICSANRANLDLEAKVYSIGFGPISGGCVNAQTTLDGIALCGQGDYYGSQNASELENIYAAIAQTIVNASYSSQTVSVVNGSINITDGLLYGYPQSYIEFTYDPVDLLDYGEISLTQKTDPFNDPVNCAGYVSIPGNTTVAQFKVTSYSGSYWTDYLGLENSLVSTEPYKLWAQYPGVPYVFLGDPYIINIPDPQSIVAPGEVNNVTVGTGNSQSQRTNCSADDRAIYTIRLRSLVGYGDVYSESEGCEWTIQFEDASFINSLRIPTTYAGNNSCSYTTAAISGYEGDAVNDAVYRLLAGLDPDSDGRVDILFDPDAIEFKTGGAGGVRSLWGPVEVKLIVWM